MKSEWKTFSIVFVVAAILVTGVIFIGKKGNTGKKETARTSEQSSDEEGNVKGASSGSEDAGYQERLAKALTEKGVVLYGAYWCPHCKEQKAMFGDAVKYLNYVECDAAGENANPDECQAKEIKSYPTWIYRGTKYNGTRTLAELASLINFSDSSDQSGVNDSNNVPGPGDAPSQQGN